MGHKITRFIVSNLDRVIDRNYYPVPEAKHSNLKHRPMGIGVQGMADLFARMKIAFDEPKAMETNRRIFECLYHAALTESAELAQKYGKYSTFDGSQLSKGLL